jgi:outer membrane protein assembly factor BamA
MRGGLGRCRGQGALAPALVVLLAVATGCGAQTKKPKTPICSAKDLSNCIIEDVDILGNKHISDGDIEDNIATAESAHPLGGVLKGIPVVGLTDLIGVDYEHFDRFVLERDLSRIERYYRARGYYEAQVRAGRAMPRKDHTVRVEIVVSEGEPTRIRKVELKWRDWRLPAAEGVMKPVLEAKDEGLQVNALLDEDTYDTTKKNLIRAMTDNGFPYADVSGQIDVDLPRHKADVTFTVELGPKATFGDIKIEGLGELPEKRVREKLDFKKGDMFSTKTLREAEIALGELGVFGSVEAKPELAPPGKPRSDVVPVTIIASAAALRGVKLGGGFEVGSRVEAHALAAWEDRNFLGGLRYFSVEVRPGLVFFPWAINNLFTTLPTNVLPEVRSRFELRQPAVFEARTTAIFRGGVSLYRLPDSVATLLVIQDLADTKNINLIGYQEYAGSVGLERRFGASQHYVGQFINIQYDNPFSYNNKGVPYDPLLITSLETTGTLDFRRNTKGDFDRVNYDRGVYGNINLQGALIPRITEHPLGGDFRVRLEGRGFVPVAKRVTLAFRLVSGLLFPAGYGDTIDDPGVPDIRDLQIFQFRGFYSGGPTSNRGYPYNGVGRHAEVGFLSPNQAIGVPLPTGGAVLLETSLEARIKLVGDLGTTLFIDASDVMPNLKAFRLNMPHISAGFGLRYETPVGPARLELGFRIPCLQELGYCGPLNQETQYIGAATDLLGIPMAVNIALGNAF